MTTTKLPREQTEFVTAEGIGSFPVLYPGQAQPSAKSEKGAMSYKLELILSSIATAASPSDDGSLYMATARVAHHYDPANWERHCFGPLGRFPTLEERIAQTGKRKAEDYKYAQGKHLVTISTVFYPDSYGIGMKDANLNDPAVKQKYMDAVSARAPGVRKYCNPNNPADVAVLVAENEKRRLNGVAPILEADFWKTTIPVPAHEFWPGCFVRVSGSAYWSPVHKTVLLGLTHVLMTRQGERLVAERSPDAAFAGFAPPSEMAPPAPAFNPGAPPLPAFLQKPATPSWAQ